MSSLTLEFKVICKNFTSYFTEEIYIRQLVDAFMVIIAICCKTNTKMLKQVVCIVTIML